MVPLQLLALKQHVGYDTEHNERDNLLDDLELHEREGATITQKTNTIGWYLTTILQKGDNPREENHADQRPMTANARIGQLEVAIPGQRHEHIAQNEQQNGIDALHIVIM